MKALTDHIQKIRFTKNSAPFALLGAMVLAYGILIPWLGFYQDDWHHVYYAYARGIDSLWELLSYDGRPFAGWVYVTGFSLLGFKPIAWQISTLILRWLTVSFIWAVFEQLWPDRTRQNFTAALFFAIYPFFLIQPLSVAYAVHWSGYLLYALSMWLMLLAVKYPRRFALFTVLALAAEAIQLFTLEYFAGIELLRPILLWFILSDENGRKKAWQVTRRWLPYLIVFTIYFIWRGFIYHSPVAARNVPRGLNGMLTSPLSTMQFILVNLLPDLVLMLFSTWFSILTPDSVDFKSTVNLFITGLSLFSAAIIYFYFWRQKGNDSAPDSHWNKQAFVLGFAAVLLGLLPAYGGEFFPHSKLAPWNARFAMGSLFGAGLLVTWALETLINSANNRRIVMALLAGLTIGFQVSSENDFRHAWEAETNFYRQLILRAPTIAPNTTFLAESEFLGLMGDYPTSFALNTLYAKPGGVSGGQARTWLFLIVSNFGGRIEALLSGIPMEDAKHSTQFSGKSTDSLIINYEPQLGQCLWVISPENANIPIVPGILKDISPLTNLNLIEQSDSPPPFLQTIFPTQPDDWCAYYQRGSLTHQLKDWNKTIALWQEASEKGFHPANGLEYLPFIEAYAQVGNWNQAFELTKTSNKLSKGMENALCSAWSRFQQQTESSPERDNAIVKVKEALGCK